MTCKSCIFVLVMCLLADAAGDTPGVLHSVLGNRFTFDIGGLLSLSDIDQNPSTGEVYDGLNIWPEYGIALGTHFRVSKSNSIGIWSDVGIGEVSMVLISHLGIGAELIHHVSQSRFSLGPTLGLDTDGLVWGGTFFYRAIFLRPCVGFLGGKVSLHCHVGVSL